MNCYTAREKQPIRFTHVYHGHDVAPVFVQRSHALHLLHIESEVEDLANKQLFMRACLFMAQTLVW